MLPGIPPTGRNVEVPLVVAVNLRGDKICYEHIFWDQASVLVQTACLTRRVCRSPAAIRQESFSTNLDTLMKRWAESG